MTTSFFRYSFAQRPLTQCRGGRLRYVELRNRRGRRRNVFSYRSVGKKQALETLEMRDQAPRIRANLPKHLRNLFSTRKVRMGQREVTNKRDLSYLLLKSRHHLLFFFCKILKIRGDKNFYFFYFVFFKSLSRRLEAINRRTSINKPTHQSLYFVSGWNFQFSQERRLIRFHFLFRCG